MPEREFKEFLEPEEVDLHLSVAEMNSYLGETMDRPSRESADLHLEDCAMCREDLKDLALEREREAVPKPSVEGAKNSPEAKRKFPLMRLIAGLGACGTASFAAYALILLSKLEVQRSEMAKLQVPTGRIYEVRVAKEVLAQFISWAPETAGGEDVLMSPREAERDGDTVTFTWRFKKGGPKTVQVSVSDLTTGISQVVLQPTTVTGTSIRATLKLDAQNYLVRRIEWELHTQDGKFLGRSNFYLVPAGSDEKSP